MSDQADAPFWDTLARGAGRVMRDPVGRLFLEVQVGETWWSAPFSPEATAVLDLAIHQQAADT